MLGRYVKIGVIQLIKKRVQIGKYFFNILQVLWGNLIYLSIDLSLHAGKIQNFSQTCADWPSKLHVRDQEEKDLVLP